MGATNTDHYSDSQNKMAIIAKALGHPARLAIVEHLLTVNACSCGDIVKMLPLAQPTVSRHLKELKNAEIIKGEVKGNTVFYRIEKQTIKNMSNFLLNMLEKPKQMALNTKKIIPEQHNKLSNEKQIKELMVKNKKITAMNTHKNEILHNICYTERVYERINKKLHAQLSKKQIEALIFEVINKTEEKFFEKIGKNYYVTNRDNDIRITINSNTLRIITVDRMK